MNQIDQALILKLLEIIGYQKDKDALVKKIDSLLEQKALQNLFDNLTKDDQNSILQSNEEELKKVLLQKITPEALNKEYRKVCQSYFEEYFKSITPTLTSAQIEQIRTRLLRF